MEQLYDSFKNPKREYAIYPIIHGAAALERRDGKNPLAETLLSRGFAGIVGNVPYRDNFPDDAVEWEDTKRGFESFINLGMKTWIYDEKGYPSGTAGGVVLERSPEHPEYQAKGLYCYEYWRTLTGPGKYRSDVPGDRLEYALLLPLDGGEAVDITACKNEHDTLYFDIPQGSYHLFMMSSRRLFDGTHAAESYSEPRNYINLCDAGATRKFLEVTHEKYAEILGGEFGRGVRAFFTDEPSLISWNIRTAVYPILPWHRDFPAKFEAKYGYSFALAASAVVTRRGPEVVKRRCDFWEFVATEVSENYFGVIQDWCRAHGLASSGHMLAEESLTSHVYCYGSLYKCAKRMDWPGIDQLDSEPNRLMNTYSIPIARMLASFSDVYGGGEVFTEFSDHTSRMENRQIGMNWIKASVNWHYAMGVNNMTSYYSFDNFTDDEIRDLNKYTARIGQLIRLGKRMSRVAVLYPEASIWAAYTPSTRERAVDTSPDTQRVERTFAKLSWELLHRQIDFDYIDEQLISDGEIRDGKLCYNDREYESIVFPATNVLSLHTVKKIVAMLDAGIGIVFVGDLPELARETGAKAGFYELLSPYFGRPNFAVIPISDGWALPSAKSLRALSRPVRVAPNDLGSVMTGAEGSASISDSEVISDGILSHTRLCGDGSKLVFLCNMNGGRYYGHLFVDGAKNAELLTPADGEHRPATVDVIAGQTGFAISLRPYEACFYLVK